MAISLCSALVLVTLSQAPPVAPTDSLATLRGRAAQDSSDAQLWLLMGRAYLGLGVEAHGATHRSSGSRRCPRSSDGSRRARHRGGGTGPRGGARRAVGVERGGRQRPRVSGGRVGGPLVARMGGRWGEGRRRSVGTAAHGPACSTGAGRAG